MTKIFTPFQIDESVALLRRGELVALPTETVYGLGADATNDDAVNKIFRAKNRPSDNPLIIHIHVFEQITDWADDIPDTAKILADAFWPGPLTLLLNRKKSLSHRIVRDLQKVAIRMPNHGITLQVIQKLGKGIAAPSANLYQQTSPTTVEHVLNSLSGKIAAVIDGGPSHVGVESTIIDLAQTPPCIMRPGPISANTINKILGKNVKKNSNSLLKIPGNQLNHYQPKTPLYVLGASEILERILFEDNFSIMYHSNLFEQIDCLKYKMPSDRHMYARLLYKTLHDVDKAKPAKLFVESPPKFEDWDDINDRLQKATFKN